MFINNFTNKSQLQIWKKRKRLMKLHNEKSKIIFAVYITAY